VYTHPPRTVPVYTPTHLPVWFAFENSQSHRFYTCNCETLTTCPNQLFWGDLNKSQRSSLHAPSSYDRRVFANSRYATQFWGIRGHRKGALRSDTTREDTSLIRFETQRGKTLRSYSSRIPGREIQKTTRYFRNNVYDGEHRISKRRIQTMIAFRFCAKTDFGLNARSDSR